VISLVITVVGGLALYQPKQYAWVGDQTGYSPAQPIEFSHKVHAKENAIPCEYCHSGARKGPVAGIPAASTCMNCHSEIGKKSPEVQKLAAALKEGRPIHVTTGVKCQTCHGPVETMARIQQTNAMSMGWCVQCHRDTAAASEKAKAFDDAHAALARRESKRGPNARPSTECSACHF
jgi:hypothetical protein